MRFNIKQDKMSRINYSSDMIKCQVDIKLYLLYTLAEDRKENDIFRYQSVRFWISITKKVS